MPAVPVAPERLPRRARYLLPRGTPRRAEILAALGLAVLLAGGLFAQLTLVVAVACHVVSKASRWRPVWLAAPAGAGLVWSLAIGPSAALARFGAVPAAVSALLARVLTDPLMIGRLGQIPGVIGNGSGGQLPVALILGSGGGAAAWWLSWLHTSEWDAPEPRPGLIAVARRAWTRSFARSGGILTRDGICLGTAITDGRPAAVSWREAAGGVLVTGTSWPSVAATSMQFLHGAIRRRKPVIVVDLAADPELPGALAEACAAVGAPLHTFGTAGPGCYEPFRGRPPGDAADLACAVIDWTDVATSAARAGREAIAAAFAVAMADPAQSPAASLEAAAPLLDDVSALLRPGLLRARAARMPASHPGRADVAERAGLAAAWLERDPGTAALMAGQLTDLRASALGRWLAPAEHDEQRISLAAVVRSRAVAYFALDRAAHARSAGMIATLVALDAAAVYAGLEERGIALDGLAWFSGCERASAPVLAGLAAPGSRLAVVLATASPGPAASLVDAVAIRAVHRLADPGLASQIASVTGTRLVPAQAAPGGADDHSPVGGGLATGLRTAVPLGMVRAPRVPAAGLCALPDTEFVLIGGPRPVMRARAVTTGTAARTAAARSRRQGAR